VLPAGAASVMVMEFKDEAGVWWSRTNDQEPDRLNL
jgi:hypothetical protein